MLSRMYSSVITPACLGIAEALSPKRPRQLGSAARRGGADVSGARLLRPQPLFRGHGR
jgi:hypothetical protein